MSVEKIIKPSIYASELRDRLLLDGVVDADDLPSASQINKRVRRDLVMSKKKLSVIPSESNTPEQIARQDEYLNVISTFKPHQIHFFDEASVIKTTGNRSYGNATVGEKAIEFQRYASNANFTVNLLHSLFGVDYYNILDGPSNGFELLHFFEDAVEIQREVSFLSAAIVSWWIIAAFTTVSLLSQFWENFWMTTVSNSFICHRIVHI